MERRKILLGSGAALATVLAGCSSSETGEEEPENDSEESFGDDSDDTGSSSDADSGTGNGDDSDDSGSDDDVPGVNNDEIEVSDDLVTITSIEKNGDKLDVVARTETTDIAELKAVFKTFASDLDGAIEDIDRLIEEIATIEWVLEHEGSRVLEVFIDVEWVVDYLEGELSDEEFANKVIETKE